MTLKIMLSERNYTKMYTLCDFISITLENTNNLKEQKADGGRDYKRA